MEVNKDKIEAAAKAIYNLWDGVNHPPWQEGGNSDKQYLARKYAAAAIASQAAPQEPAPDRAAQARQSATTAYALAAQVNDLAALCRRLLHAMSHASPGNTIAKMAANYLVRNGLKGDPLRTEDVLREVSAPAPVVAVDALAVERIADELEQEAQGYEGDFADVVNGCVDALRKLATQPAQAPAGEPVGEVVADHTVHGWHMQALKPWNEIGAGTKLYAAPVANAGQKPCLTCDGQPPYCGDAVCKRTPTIDGSGE